VDLERRLDEIERSLDDHTYRPGPWQAFLEQAEAAAPSSLASVEADVNRVSDKLHQRIEPRIFPFERLLAWEILGATAGLVALGIGAFAQSALLLVAALALCTARGAES